MDVLVGNWVGEITTTVGRGVIGLGGNRPGFTTFDSIENAIGSEFFYAIVEGNNREAGIGTLVSKNQFERTDIASTIENGVYSELAPQPIELKGSAEIFATFNARAFAYVFETIARHTFEISILQAKVLHNEIDLDGKVDKSGDIMVGQLVLPDAPVDTINVLDAVNRKYVDSASGTPVIFSSIVPTNLDAIWFSLAVNRAFVYVEDAGAWLDMAPGGTGGSGGGATPLSFTMSLIANGPIDMANLGGVHNMNDPRIGVVGDQDAVTKKFMHEAIAANALYQGTYKSLSDDPDLITLSDSGFVWPLVNTQFNNPNDIEAGINPNTPAAGNSITWFEAGSPLNAFPFTIVNPYDMTVYLNNGKIVNIIIPPATYADAAALQTELKLHITGTDIANIYQVSNSTSIRSWTGVETKAPLNTVHIGNAATPFPVAVEGAANKILNGYNWVVQTGDVHITEVIGPGIPGILSGTIIKNADTIQWSDALKGFSIIQGGQLTQTYADQNYWQIKVGNMIWRDVSYNTGAIVMQSDAWYKAARPTNGGLGQVPGSTIGANFWTKVGAGTGELIYLGFGHFNLAGDATLTAANNWGMPTGTIPSNREPVTGDVYLDLHSGETAVFTATNNPPSNELELNYDPTVNNSLGAMSYGNVAGEANFNDFTVDGVASNIPFESFYTFIVPAVITQTIPLTAVETWTGPADAHDISSMPVANQWIDTGPVAMDGGLIFPEWSGISLTNAHIVDTGSRVFTGISDEGVSIVKGWALYSGAATEPAIPAGGDSITLTPRAAAQKGHFTGKTVASGNYVIIWSGDPDSENNGWAIVPDTGVYPITHTHILNTGHPTPATVTAIETPGQPQTPVGGIIMWSVPAIPNGWLLCNGQAIPPGREWLGLRNLLGTSVPDMGNMFPRAARNDAELLTTHADTTRLPTGLRVSGATADAGEHTHQVYMTGVDYDEGQRPNGGYPSGQGVGRGQGYSPQDTARASGIHHHDVDLPVSGAGDPETAPANIRLYFIIRGF